MRSPKKKARQGKKTIGQRKNFRLGLAALLGVFILIVDQLSKYFIHNTIERMSHESQWYPYNGIGVFEDFFGINFSIVHTINHGAAWGMFSDFQDALFTFRIVFIFALTMYLVFFNKNRWMTLPLTLIIAGALGNIIDFFVYGHVVDMFYFVLFGYDFPVFNVADISIFLGVTSVIFLTLFNQKKTLTSKS